MDAFARLELKKLLDRLIGIPLVQAMRALDALLWLFQSHGPVVPRRIVLAKLWGVGNLVMILPLVRALRERFPDAYISFLTLEENRPLLDGHADLDRVDTIRSRGVVRPLLDLVRVLWRLRGERVDLFLDFEQFMRATPLIAYLAGAQQRVGFRTPGQARAALYNAKVPYTNDRHMTAVFGDIVRAAGVLSLERHPRLAVPRDALAGGRVRDRLERGLRGSGPLVMLHPGSGDNFPGRRWPAERFAELGATLEEEFGARLLLTGAAAERPLTGQVAELVRGLRPHADLVDLGGELSLIELIELVARVDLLVTNDTAPVHLAGALDVSVIALYGPNTPLLYGPLHARGRAIYHALPCGPCLTNMNMKSSSCRMPSCVLGIEVAEVLREARRLLVTPGGVAHAESRDVE